MQQDTPEEEYEYFYVELPQSDFFLTDTPIEDAYDTDEGDSSDTNKIRGLSDKQVSELADDQLGEQNQHLQAEQNLFSNDDPADE